jgi:hypothetical protein
MQEMETVSETIDQLRTEGYTEDLNLQNDSLYWVIGNLKILHDEFVIDKYFRFEGISDPADEATVYAISAHKYNIKGILVNGAGIYSDQLSDEMLRTLKIGPQKIN